MTKEELAILQSYPLDVKIAKTKARIREFVRYFGEESVFISFSGGKDSTVLLDIAREEFPNIHAVFCDTGLEYPEIKDFVKTVDNVETIRPRKSFKQVLSDYGYPIISKEQSGAVYEIRTTKSDYLRNKRLNTSYGLAKKWRFLLDAPFLISRQCCYHLKKSPFFSYENRNKRYPITATLADESFLRRSAYIKTGCNLFDSKHPRSSPLSFWKTEDILEYIEWKGLDIAPVYGPIRRDKENRLYMDGINRTGCIFCAYGCQHEKCPNRYQRLKCSHPKLYDYCINGGEFDSSGMWKPNKDGLGFGFVLDYIGIDYK